MLPLFAVTLFTSPSSTVLWTTAANWSVDIVDNFISVFYIVVGLIAGALILRLIYKAVVGAIKTVLGGGGRRRGGRRGRR